MKIKNFFYSLIVIFISSAITILALDCLGRILLKRNNLPLSDKPAINANTYFYQSNEKYGLLRYELRPGFKGHEWSTNFSINSYGFRGHDFKLDKPAGTIRILCLGDSCTFGTGGLEDADTYPMSLEKLLNENQNTKNFEVLNAGMPGSSVFEGFVFLKARNLMELNPDLVIICYGWNDHMRFAIDDRSAAIQRSVNYFLKKNFMLWRYFSYRWKNKFEAKKHPTPNCPLRVNQSQYKYYLSKIIDLARRYNSKVLLMTAPWEPRLMHENIGWLQESTLESFYLHQSYVDLTKNIWQEKRVMLVDLYAIFEHKKTNNPNDLFFDPFHYNKNGASLVASAVCKVVKKMYNSAE